MFEPSKYQQAVFDFLKSGTGHLVVKAVAGSGKTTTAIEGSKRIRGSSVVYVAFNRSAKDNLNKKLKEHKDSKMKAKTVHGLGYRCIQEHRSAFGATSSGDDFEVPGTEEAAIIVEEDKYLELAMFLSENDRFLSHAAKKLWNMARLTWKKDTLLEDLSDEFLMSLALHFGIDAGEEAIKTFDLVRLLSTQPIELNIIDYADMLWLPVYLRMRTPQIDWIFIDECQDLSSCALELILMHATRKTRMVFVGDPMQAIYGFAGADADSFWRIRDLTEATVLPLSCCYRCPTSVIALAQRFCPKIEAREDAPEGRVEYVPESALMHAQPKTDIVLCRWNAPLVRQCLAFIRGNRPAFIKDKPLADALTTVIEKIARKTPIEGFIEALELWKDRQVRKINSSRGSVRDILTAVRNLDDKAEAVRVVFEACEPQTYEDLQSGLARLFTPSKKAIELSTIHRAKGLERERVWVLQPECLFDPRADGWQLQQEYNLAYVAFTRAESELFLVSNERVGERV